MGRRYDPFMRKATVVKKLAAAAVVCGGGLSIMCASLYGVLRAEALMARRQIGDADGEPPNATGWYGHGRPGPGLRMALLGDSSMAGYGVQTVQDTPGARLASGLAEGADRRGSRPAPAVVRPAARGPPGRGEKAVLR